MSMDIVEAASRWQRLYGDKLEITFHGGEPLVAGVDFYREALPLLQNGLAHRRVRFSMQSNLWLLTDELCTVLKEHNVSLGTSLDGPEPITDAQRGHGYYRRTMKGVQLAHSYGIDVGCICTFTPSSLPHLGEIFDFFVEEGLNFTIHACTPSLRHPEAKGWALSAEEHGQLLADSLAAYLENLDRVRIGTLDSLCRSISAGRGGLCSFTDCLGSYTAVGPDGGVYPCQRFTGMPGYVMGNVMDAPSLERIHLSAVWRMFDDRQVHIEEECGACAHLDLCRGGCPYNALVEGNGRFKTLKDSHCEAYRHIFNRITDQALEEVFSAENMREVVAHADSDKGLLRRGKLLSLMRDGPHPYETARHARRIVASVALAATDSPEEAGDKLQSLHVLNGKHANQAIQAFYHRLNAPQGYNKLYLHVTFACNLRCTHCYADAGSTASVLSVEEIVEACRDAARLGFQRAVITGGEPLMHPERDRLLDELASIREEVKPMLTVLRTNGAVEAGGDLLRRLGHSTDEVVVSVDGDRYTHDARRGNGSYDRTVRTVKALTHAGYDTNLRLAAVLPIAQVNGTPGDAVRKLARELNIGHPKFRPILPLGRAANAELEMVPDTTWGHMHPRDMVEYGYAPAVSCGIGHNLYVEPDGQAYPCYAWHGAQWRMGSIREQGLEAVLTSRRFVALRSHTVNTNRLCKGCTLRYMCGGACRAWNRQPASLQTDLDAPPVDCSRLKKRARSLFVSALDLLGVAEDKWVSAGLPLP
jgi:uncharacterized protein